MRSRVRALNITHVRPAGTGAPSPPWHAEYKLSFLDLFHLARTPTQLLFFFDGPDLPPFPSIVSTLQSSLANTLAVFCPLAGKLAFRASSGDVVVDCSPAAVASGVKFVEAEFFGGADDMRRLARDEEHDTEAFRQLVPELEAALLPSPVLAVQVTRPAKGEQGAVAVGVSFLHAVADGHAVWKFLRAWSTVAREGLLDAAGLPPPTFDRTSIRHDKGDELARTCLNWFAPALPVLESPSASARDTSTQQRRRTFVFRHGEIQTLKQHILLQQTRAANGGKSCKPPSTYVTISSLAWTSVVRSKPAPHDDDDAAYFVVNADCRRRLRPPLGDGFFGNCVKTFHARARDGDLRGEAGLAHAASAIQDAIREHMDELGDDPLSDIQRCLALHRAVPRARLTAAASSHRFAEYETDFGWGAPSRVELVSAFPSHLEVVSLHGAREAGAVQVSVALDRAVMDAFAACFVAPASDPSPARGSSAEA